MGEKFVYDAEIGDNTKFVYTPKMEQKAKFVYKELGEISNSPSHMNVKLNHQTGLASLNHETERKSNNFIHRNNIDHDAWRIIKCQHSS